MSASLVVRLVPSLDGVPAMLIAGVLLVEDTGSEELNAIVIRLAKEALEQIKYEIT